MSKVKTVQQKYNRLTQWTKEIKNYIYQLRTKLKHKVKNKIKARCQVGNKAMKTKLRNMLVRKGRKKKENFIELQKPNVESQVYNNNKKCDWIYKYTYTPISKIKRVQTKIKFNRLTRWTEETKSYMYQLRTKLMKGQTGKQN